MVEIGSLRKTVYDFASEDEQELALHVGDVVQVLQWIDKQWCHGVSNGREGNFPSGYTIDIKLPPLEDNQVLFAPFTDFDAQENGDLSFKKGDLVVGLRAIDNNWWEGKCNGNQGIFPITHVWKINQSLLPKSLARQKMLKKARVKMDLKAQLKEEMDLNKGDIVTITEEVDRGWYRGECQGKTGIFPSSFVTILTDDNIESVNTESSSSTNSSHTEEPIPSISIMTNGTLDQYGYDCVTSGITAYGRSLYQFAAEYPNELSFREGEILNLIRHVDEKWMEGELDGRVGIFPKNFIDIIVDCPGAISSTSDNSFPPDTYGRVLHEFNVQNDSETKLAEGDTVTLLRQIDSNYYEVQADKSSVPMPCPISYIEVIGSGPDLLPPSYYEAVQQEPNMQFSLQNGIRAPKSERPQSYPSTSFNQASIHSAETEFKNSQSINDKIAENLMSLNLSATSRINSSPSLSRRSYSVSSGGDSSFSFNDGRKDFRPIASQSGTLQRNESFPIPSTYENVTSCQIDPWDMDVNSYPKSSSHENSSAHQQTKAPVRPSPPLKNTSYNGTFSHSVISRQESNVSDTLDTNTIIPSNVSQEDAAQREIIVAQKREAEEKRRAEEKKKKMKEQRACVITELIQTEKDYKSDLQILYDTFVRDSEQAKSKGIEVETLFGNLDEVIDVASRLLRRLEKVANCSSGQQTIGQCFVDMSEEMKEVYGHYCRNHDDVNAVLDKYDERSPAGQYLKHKVEQMKRQTNCFDLPSMLIKPVQRILKYPLLLNELVKCTEDVHPDKQSLIAAIGLMTDVATAINEFKRRKDLVFKYRKHADTSLSGRISKLSLHSMLKKSSRFGMRISNSIGLTHVTKDESFAKIERQFHALEKTIKIFMRDVNVYMEKTEELVKTAFLMAEDIAELYQERKTQQEVDQFRSVHRIIATQFWEANKQVLDRNVLNILKQLLLTFQGPINLIDKRYDKLLDYEACTNKLEKNKDVMKIKMLQDNLQRAKNTYEALNSQLLDELPKLYSNSVEILQDCICCFLKAKKNFIGKSAREILPLTDLPLLLGSQGGALETFHVKHTLVTDNLCQMSIVPKQLFPPSKTSTLKRNSSPAIPRLSFGASSQAKNQSKQRSSDQVFVVSSYPIDQQYVACENFDAVDVLDVSVRRDDVVGIIKQQDPMGNKLRWFIDKGGSKGFVPAKVLKRRSMPSTTPQQQQSTTDSAPEMTDPAPEYSQVMRNTKAGATQNRKTAQPVRPAPPVGFGGPGLPQQVVPANVPTVTHTVQNVPNSSRSSSMSCDIDPPHRYEEIDDLLVGYDSISEVPTTEKSSTVSVEEFDPYGPIIKHPQLYDNIPEVVQDASDHRYEVIPDDVVDVSQYYYALFDFCGQGESQLKIIKGQVVLVLHQCDLNRNPEWWFVEDRFGEKGYVPANYLMPYPMTSGHQL